MKKKISIENAEHYSWGDNCDGWHLVKDPKLSVIEERVPPGGSEVRHYHRHADQFFYVLDGIATIVTGTDRQQLAMREGIHIPAGTVHQLLNETTTELRFIVFSTPPSHGDRVTD